MMAILVREGLRHVDDHSFLSLQIWRQGEHLWTDEDWVGKAASKAFGLRALKIPWIYLGRIK